MSLCKQPKQLYYSNSEYHTVPEHVSVLSLWSVGQTWVECCNMSRTSAHTKPQTDRDPVIGLLPWHWNPCFPKPLWTEDRGGEIWGIQEEAQTMAHTQRRWDPITHSRTAAAEAAAAAAAAAAGPRVCSFSCIPSPDLRFQLGVRATQPRWRTPHPPDRPGSRCRNVGDGRNGATLRFTPDGGNE